jgi:hypothetical protein
MLSQQNPGSTAFYNVAAAMIDFWRTVKHEICNGFACEILSRKRRKWF